MLIEVQIALPLLEHRNIGNVTASQPDTVKGAWWSFTDAMFIG